MSDGQDRTEQWIKGPAGRRADDARSQIEMFEARKRQAETFTWAVPPLAIAAQAFLLTIALRPDTRPLAMAVAAFAGLATTLAALHFLGKHAFNFDWYEAAIERGRARLGLSGFQRNYVLGEGGDERFLIPTFAEDSTLRRREWWISERWFGGGPPLRYESHNRHFDWIYRVRHRVIVRWKAVWVWGIALCLLASIDVLLFIYAMVVWKAGDPGWFSQDNGRVMPPQG
jgi:hypothetical protein